MLLHDLRFDELAMAYLTGDISPDDMFDFELRLKADASARSRLAELSEQEMALRQIFGQHENRRQLPPDSAVLPTVPETRRGGKSEVMRARRSRVMRAPRVRKRTGPFWVPMTLAAGFLLFVLLFFFMNRQPARRNRVADGAKAPPAPLPEPESVTRRAGSGTRQSEPGTSEAGPGARRPGPETSEPGPGTREAGPGTRRPGPGARRPGPETSEPGPGTREPGPGTSEPGPGTSEPDLRPEEKRPVGNVIFVAHVDDPTRAMSLCRREGDRERRLPLVEGMELLVGDLIDTGSADPYAEEIRPVRAKVSIRSGTLDLADETNMEAISGKEVRMVGDCGLMYAETRSILAASQLTVRTRHAVVSPSSGTTLDVSVADGGTAVTVEKGKAAVRNERGGVSIGTLQKSVARADRKPSPPVAVYAHAVWRGRKGPLEIPPIKGKVAVRSFTLIDADRDVPIAGFDPLPTGSVVLNLARLPTRNLNIRANTVPDDGISVRFDLNGKTKRKLEQVAPYAFHGDRFSDYDAWTPRVGTYVITATPFVNLKGLGASGKALQLTVKIVDR